jgi:hypothetical protein
VAVAVLAVAVAAVVAAVAVAAAAVVDRGHRAAAVVPAAADRATADALP